MREPEILIVVLPENDEQFVATKRLLAENVLLKHTITRAREHIAELERQIKRLTHRV
jgi:hypothetical protein